MKSPQKDAFGSIKATIVAVVCALALTGCSKLPFDLPFELPQLPDLPFELPQIDPSSLPGLSNLPNPFAAFGVSTSVEDARKEQISQLKSTLTADDLVEAGVLTVGLKKDISAPFVIEGSGGGLYGIDIDLASALAARLGLSVKFVSVNEVDYPLEAGTCDVVLDATARHATRSALVGSYYESCAAFFALGERRLVTVAELESATVAVQDGSVSQGVLGRTSLNMDQRVYANLNEAFDALVAGEVSYVLCDAYPGAYLAEAYDNVSFVGALNTPVLYSVAVSSSNANLQEAATEAMNTVLHDGTMDIVRSMWIGGMEPLTEADIIADVPVVEGSSVDEWQEAQDGSGAGANAVIL